MRSVRLFVFVAGLFALTGGLAAQDPAKKDPAKEAKKDDPSPKIKGQLPQGWKALGLTDDQKQKVYKIANKYAEEIDKLEAQIADLKKKRDKERLEVLTPEQKKKLEDAGKEKAGGGK